MREVTVPLLVAILLTYLFAPVVSLLERRLRFPRPLAAGAILGVGGFTVLLALALPPTSPWWLTLIGVGFAIVVAKQLYGGLGMNPFNPAMIGYVLLLISFPVAMTQWIAPGEAPLRASNLTTRYGRVSYTLSATDAVEGKGGLRDVLVAKEVPACNEMQCGWAASHSLEGAQKLAKGLLDKRSEWTEVFA